jgi:hypothetical protein
MDRMERLKDSLKEKYEISFRSTNAKEYYKNKK